MCVYLMPGAPSLFSASEKFIIIIIIPICEPLSALASLQIAFCSHLFSTASAS